MMIHIKIYGRVQGVGFRSFVRDKGENLGLSGWTRNRISGCVEVLADGSQKQIDDFLLYCHKGPFFARVDRIEPVSVPDAPIFPIEFGLFQIQPTV